jgi:O-antigen biosynthesis protein WbqP
MVYGAKWSGCVRADCSEQFPQWKRTEDLVVALLFAALLLIPALVIAVAIVINSGWPPLIRQRRVGTCGGEFLMWKFRSLPVNTPQVAKGDLQRTGVKATSLGRLLRRTSIDELPQLVNVLLGEMSLVGPRPALFNQQELTDMRLKRGVLRVRPGLTGLAQVSGREDLSLERKVDLDATYVRTMSPTVDLTIALRTVEAVLSGRGNR